MRAFHVISSQPIKEGRHLSALESKFDAKAKATDKCLHFPDYTILLAIVSALQWKKTNGNIRLYADSTVANEFQKLGILEIWDDYNTDVLNAIDWNYINSTVFWPSGKFFAYLNEPAPCVAIDIDMIVWKNLKDFYQENNLLFTHWESVEHSYWYCDKDDLKCPPTYKFKKEWGWRTAAANTSLIYFGSSEFKDYYTAEALRYISKNSLGLVSKKAETPELLFAEQRLLLMCAKEKGIKFRPFLDTVWSPSLSYFTKHDQSYGRWDFPKIDNQSLFTHAWFYKRHIEDHQDKKTTYCKQLVSSIKNEFPKTFKALREHYYISKYV